ncbi:MAG: hypothetical protein IIB61_04805 [Planctomycetes bacterium]|nr:hypothetical protein [Planctomycetota bacterium]
MIAKDERRQRISVAPSDHHGAPGIAGTRVPVGDIAVYAVHNGRRENWSDRP